MYSIYSKFYLFFGYTFFGLLATAVHFSCLYALVDILHVMKPVNASIVAFLCGAVVGFICNRTYVFKGSNAGLSALSKYLILTGSGLVNNTILMYILVDVFEKNYMLSQAASSLVIFLFNYSICKYLIFKVQPYAE